MLRNLKLWQKLGLLSLAFVIPTLVLVVLLRQEKNLAIDFAEKESAGNHYLGGLKSVLEGLPLYGMTGDSGAAAKSRAASKPRGGRAAVRGAAQHVAAPDDAEGPVAEDHRQRQPAGSRGPHRAAHSERRRHLRVCRHLEPDPRPGPRFLLHDGSGRPAQRREPAQHLRRRQDGPDAADGSRRQRQERMQLLVQLGTLRQGVDNHRAGMAKAASQNPGGQLGATRNGLEGRRDVVGLRRPRDAQRRRPRRLRRRPVARGHRGSRRARPRRQRPHLGRRLEGPAGDARRARLRRHQPRTSPTASPSPGSPPR